MQQIRQQGAETGPDLGDGAFAASRSARADRQGAGDDFDQRHAGTDLPLTRWYAAMTASVPCPSASGAKL